MRNPLAAFLSKSSYGSNKNGKNLSKRGIKLDAVRILSWTGVGLFPASLMFFVGSQNLLGTMCAVLGGVMLLNLAMSRDADTRHTEFVHGISMTLAVVFGVAAVPTGFAAGLLLVTLGFVFSASEERLRTGIAVLGLFGVAAVAVINFEVASPYYAFPASIMFYAIALAHLAEAILKRTKKQSAGDREQVKAFRQLVESVRDAVVKYNAEGKLVYLSHTSESLYGCKRYELMGGGFVERIHVLDRPIYLTALSDVARGKSSKTIDIRMRCERGQRSEFVWLEVALSSVSERCDSEGRAEVIAIIRDITSRKQQEKDLEEAKKLAETASQAKSRFLATIGHELRTPLNAVVGFSDMMLNDIGGELSPDHREYVDLIRGSGAHLLDTVTMLLDMSKLESGKFEIHTGEMKAQELIEPCFAIVKSAADKKRVKLTSDSAKGLPSIVADERACRQVIINLLTNAVKFSEQGQEVNLSIRARGNSVLLNVTDSGIGMTASDIERLGEPFFQAENGLDRKYEGTGLGISIVKGLVELHDGELHVRSNVGAGTTMTVELPINGPRPQTPHNVLEELSDRRFEEEERRSLHVAEKRAV